MVRIWRKHWKTGALPGNNYMNMQEDAAGGKKEKASSQHNLYLNRYQNKWCCGWEALVLFLCLFSSQWNQIQFSRYACKSYPCIIFQTFPNFPANCSRFWWCKPPHWPLLQRAPWCQKCKARSTLNPAPQGEINKWKWIWFLCIIRLHWWLTLFWASCIQFCHL